jgi:uncharacterized protein (DUF1697 family)
MTTFIALLRAINVGGTGKLAMTELSALCTEAGFADVRTYIASGNVVFASRLTERAIVTTLERRLAAHAGKPIGVIVRTAPEMAAVLASNPFPHAAPNRTVALFLDRQPPSDVLSTATGRTAEDIRLGKREIYIHYGSAMATSKLKLAVAKTGTARNMNTVAKLVALAKR